MSSLTALGSCIDASCPFPEGEGEEALVSDVIYAAAAELDPLSFSLRTVRPGKMTPKVPGAQFNRKILASVLA